MYRRSSFGVVYFTTLKWAYQPLHQVAEYVKHLGKVMSVNVRQGTGFKNSGREICLSVIKLEQGDNMPRMTKPYRRSLRTLVKRVVNLPDNPTLPAKWLDLSAPLSASIFNRVLTSDEKWVLYDTLKRSKYWLSPQDTVPHSERSPMQPTQEYALCLVDLSSSASLSVATNGPNGLAPSDCHLFHSLDNHLRDKFFTKEADLRQALKDFFESHTPEVYRKEIEQLETRWQKVLDADGDYFED
ncbi:histone-lysine N-methyltransferase SETMAR [Trichonephila inaurata madagascariensis]|uniref:Histone-lysine N-methyltransferase SETMAR n=1 Tax=Trichonephila inaurata madagascariensis TaxID=2747483 RepID=A0A8X7CSG4_9ARAC|nr:histone-lysine N-methyltransferase SETMAR [Trichonephila inaurata madagascariensis]